MDLFDWVKGISAIEYKQSGGLGLALQTVEKFKGRTLRFRGSGMRHFNVQDAKIIGFIHIKRRLKDLKK
jgi:hypothetical protein